MDLYEILHVHRPRFELHAPKFSSKSVQNWGHWTHLKISAKKKMHFFELWTALDSQPVVRSAQMRCHYEEQTKLYMSSNFHQNPWCPVRERSVWKNWPLQISTSAKDPNLFLVLTSSFLNRFRRSWCHSTGNQLSFGTSHHMNINEAEGWRFELGVRCTVWKIGHFRKNNPIWKVVDGFW